MSILDDEEVLINNIENDIKFNEYWWLIKFDTIGFFDKIFTRRRTIHYDIYNGLMISYNVTGVKKIVSVDAIWKVDDEYEILPSCIDNPLMDAGIYSFRKENKEKAENILNKLDEYYPRVINFTFYEQKYFIKYFDIIKNNFKGYNINNGYDIFDEVYRIYITKK